MSGAASIFSGPAPRYFTIDAGRPFLADLARGVAESAGASLADAAIFVPTRRAARALADAFADAAGAGASLLPRITALGDVDEDSLGPGPHLEAGPGGAAGAALAPAASALERRLVLARMTAAAERRFRGQESWPAALAAADALAALLDSLYTEEIAPARLESLAPENHADHWTRALDFLKIVTRAWPDYLASRDLQDPAARRALLIDACGAALARRPPMAPVIVAGTTGSAPAVARLIRIVASLPMGAVVLPGLDRELAADGKSWAAIDAPGGQAHPQAGLKALLAAVDAAPEAVRAFPGSGAPSRRKALLSLALRPAEASDDWLDLVAAASTEDPGLAQACAGLQLIEAADEDAEAGAVALLLRGAVEQPGRTAMLVTPDRALGRRVGAKLKRWGIVADDSAGTSLADTAVGAYLRAVAGWLIAPSDPGAVLTLLRSPFAACGLASDRRDAAVAAIDRGLRGGAPGPGLDGLRAKVSQSDRYGVAAPILDALGAALARWPSRDAPYEDFLRAHLEAAELLAGDARRSGERVLWRGADGRAAAGLLAELRAMAPALGALEAGAYADSLAQALEGLAVRLPAPGHPRLAILGPLEARLHSADLVVISGLNEGVWPRDAGADPFLSRAMRSALGLPSRERGIALAAHDFAQFAAAPAAALTRARRTAGAPTQASRWIVRLKNILAGAGAQGAVDQSARYAGWTRALDTPAEVLPASPPRPAPPLAARPRALAVTRFETLMRDPYAVYAQHVLRLRRLDRIDEPLYHRRVGILLHEVFAYFTQTEDPDSAGARARLGAIFEEKAAAQGVTAADLALARPRFAAALDWFLDFERERRRLGRPAVVERKGEATFATPGGPFALSANADRIDVLTDGAAEIFDFKSGTLPTLDQMKTGFNPQLPLTALIVEAGGFAELSARQIAGFAYVKSLNRKEAGERDHTDKNSAGAQGGKARAMIEEARNGLLALVGHFDDPQTPYLSQPRPQFQKEYAQYDHLARRREWASLGDDE